MINVEKVAGGLFFCASISLACFCLFQSQRIGHDQQAREIAGQTIHIENTSPTQGFTPLSQQRALENLKKKLGEESD